MHLISLQGVLSVLLFCVRSKLARSQWTKLYNWFFPHGALYYLPSAYNGDTYRGNVLSYHEHRQGGIQLTRIDRQLNVQATSVQEVAETSLKTTDAAVSQSTTTTSKYANQDLKVSTDDVAPDDQLKSSQDNNTDPKENEGSGKIYLD